MRNRHWKEVNSFLAKVFLRVGANAPTLLHYPSSVRDVPILDPMEVGAKHLSTTTGMCPEHSQVQHVGFCFKDLYLSIYKTQGLWALSISGVPRSTPDADWLELDSAVYQQQVGGSPCPSSGQCYRCHNHLPSLARWGTRLWGTVRGIQRPQPKHSQCCSMYTASRGHPLPLFDGLMYPGGTCFPHLSLLLVSVGLADLLFYCRLHPWYDVCLLQKPHYDIDSCQD